jgi:4,5-DOPA dioxygenase extradiol
MVQMPALPALFISHGSPMMALEDSPARNFLSNLGQDIARPAAILVISAHHDAAFEGGHITITSSPTPPTVHDFGGFPAELFAMRYPAPGHPALANAVAAMLNHAGFDARLDAARGLDHGAWVPLSLTYPAADIPVVQLSIFSGQSPEWHHALGTAIAPLRAQGVLIIGSGSMTHNLRALFSTRPPIDAPPAPAVTDFTDWMADRLAAGATQDILHAVERAPNGRFHHPSMDHILPLFVAMGAGMDARGTAPVAKRLHASVTYSLLAMDVYAFG